MFGKQGKLFIVFTLAMASILLMGVACIATPNVALTIIPEGTEIVAGSSPIVINADITGIKEPTFQWKISNGPGELESPTTEPAVIYIPPESIDSESQPVIINATITDKEGNATTKTIVLTVKAPPDKTFKLEVEDCESYGSCRFSGEWKRWDDLNKEFKDSESIGFSNDSCLTNESKTDLGVAVTADLFLEFQGNVVIIVYRQDHWFGSLNVEIDERPHGNINQKRTKIKNQVEACFEVGDLEHHTFSRSKTSPKVSLRHKNIESLI